MGTAKKVGFAALVALVVSGGVVYASNNVKAAKFLKEKAVA
jgi:hypothetical protein